MQDISARRKPDVDDAHNEPIVDILVVDSGAGNYGTITSRAWMILSETNHVTNMIGYQSTTPKECKIVHGATKATIPGRIEPIIFIMNYCTLVEDMGEYESLLQPYQVMAHGVDVDCKPPVFGGTGCMSFNDNSYPFEFDGEKPFYTITKPTQEDFDNLEHLELTSVLPPIHMKIHPRRKKKTTHPHNIPMSEWRKRLA